MNKDRIWFFGSLIILIIALYLLITGSPLLTLTLNRKYSIPYGTPITWIGLISLPLTVYFGVKEMRSPTIKVHRYLSGFLKISLSLAILWAPICYLLAGNLSFSFAENEEFQGGQLAMKWFWIFNISLVISPFIILIIYWFSSLFWEKKRND